MSKHLEKLLFTKKTRVYGIIVVAARVELDNRDSNQKPTFVRQTIKKMHVLINM